MSISLTEQQQAVVDHNEGPALVFAVAGAGKTTAMVHRIERLVRERHFAPQRILATSFGKMNEHDLKAALSAWRHCQGVQVSTLHALCFRLVRTAQQRGWLRQPVKSIDIGRLDHYLLNMTMAEANRRNVSWRRELNGIDRQDFLDYIGRCKNSLAYADLGQMALPASADGLATQAEAPSSALDWYLPLYKLYEQLRQQGGYITFDDMLLSAWELLNTQEALLQNFQQQYDCVMVDEYQDINLAQSEILHLLTNPHRNYMAIGDDDQTIYQWRGADPRFILDFPKRYRARTYVISDNFRCPAAPIVLANRVIQHNRQRAPKQLNLTRGLHGKTTLQLHKTVDEMAQSVVERMQLLIDDGRPMDDIAVLVRLNAQTPPIEQKLIDARIPYRVGKPFYERAEIKVLIAYCRLAWFESRLMAGNELTKRMQQQWEEAWSLIHNRPKRYISRDLRQSVGQSVLRQQTPLVTALRTHVQYIDREFLQDKLHLLADTVEWLASALQEDAAQTLKMLDFKLQYQEWLRDSTGSPQVGEGRAVSVDSFIRYADGKGSLQTFLGHIRELAQQKIGSADPSKPRVTLSTIHQSKGLEWPIVIVPNCNQGILPFTDVFAAEIDWNAHLEEERRLFYVAMTRTREQLHLHTLKSEIRSQFLREAQPGLVAKLLNELRAAVDSAVAAAEPAPADCLIIIRHAHSLNLQRYFIHFWDEKETLDAIGRFARNLYTNCSQRPSNVSEIMLECWRSVVNEGQEKSFAAHLSEGI